MAEILDGKIVRDGIAQKLKQEITELAVKPCLVIIQVGDRPDSTAFINQKKKFADSIGAIINVKNFSESVTQQEILEDIRKYNAHRDVHGIIVQLPLPAHLTKEEVLESIDPRKDVDGLTSFNTKILFDGTKGGHMPATARGILTLLEYYKIQLTGKHVVVIGRSALVGKSVALACLNADATITIAHKETKDLKKVAQQADILIIAIGDPEFITKEYVQPGQIIIDVGINQKAGTLVGDVKISDVESIVQAITPVPGGVGPMTVASLFLNLVDAYKILQ